MPFSVSLQNFTILGGEINSASGPNFVHGSGFAVGGVRAGVAGTLTISDSVVDGTAKSAVQIWDKSLSSTISFDRCVFKNSCGEENHTPTCAPFDIFGSFDGTPPSQWCDFDVGGLTFSASTLLDTVERPFFRASGEDQLRASHPHTKVLYAARAVHAFIYALKFDMRFG